MKTIEEAAILHIYDCIKEDEYDRSKLSFKIGVEFAQRWIPVEEELPLCIESGNWDGLRSEFVLVKHLYGTWNKARLYSGIIDGNKFSDWYSDEDYELCNIIAWRPIELK